MRSRWVLIIAVLICGCSVPDDPNWGTLKTGIRTLPPMTLNNARMWTANRNAARFLGHADRDKLAFTVQCEPSVFDKSATGDEDATRYKFTVADIVRCLDGGAADVTFAQCMSKLLMDAGFSYEQTTGFDPDCIPIFEPWLAPVVKLTDADTVETTVDEFDPDAVEIPDDIARELVLNKSPTLPAWILGALTVGVGGALILGTGPAAAVAIPALCSLQAGSVLVAGGDSLQAGTGPACPGNPNYPPGDTPQP